MKKLPTLQSWRRFVKRGESTFLFWNCDSTAEWLHRRSKVHRAWRIQELSKTSVSAIINVIFQKTAVSPLSPQTWSLIQSYNAIWPPFNCRNSMAKIEHGIGWSSELCFNIINKRIESWLSYTFPPLFLKYWSNIVDSIDADSDFATRQNFEIWQHRAAEKIRKFKVHLNLSFLSPSTRFQLFPPASDARTFTGSPWFSTWISLRQVHEWKRYRKNCCQPMQVGTTEWAALEDLASSLAQSEKVVSDLSYLSYCCWRLFFIPSTGK